jgi:hypothetical protein
MSGLLGARVPRPWVTSIHRLNVVGCVAPARESPLPTDETLVSVAVARDEADSFVTLVAVSVRVFVEFRAAGGPCELIAAVAALDDGARAR